MIRARAPEKVQNKLAQAGKLDLNRGEEPEKVQKSLLRRVVWT